MTMSFIITKHIIYIDVENSYSTCEVLKLIEDEKNINRECILYSFLLKTDIHS